jgi:hypothetical protein
MNTLSRIAPVAGLCSFGLAVYAAVGRKEYVAAGIFLGIFLVSAIFVAFSRRAQMPSEPLRQSQRSGPNSTNIQAGRDVNIGGGKHGR